MQQQVDTMHSRVPLQRGGKPTEVGDLGVFLASDESSYITGEDILSASFSSSIFSCPSSAS